MSDMKIFVHIPKNAGMTVRHSPFIKPKIFVNETSRHKSQNYSRGLAEKMKETNDHLGAEHARWRDLREDYRNKFGAFAIIRNPWDRVVSRFFFLKKVIEVEQKVDPSYGDISSFEAFLEERHKWVDVEYMWHRAIRGWYPAWDHVSDDSGEKCMVDCLRHSHLEEDLKKYFDIPEMSRARNVTALNKGTYMDLYNKETTQIVADWYKKDIDYWGFDFNTGATRNYWNV